MGDLFANLFGTKSWYESLTAWGLVLYIGVTSAIDEICAQGIMPEEMCVTAGTWIANIGLVLTTLGIRKAATSRPIPR